MYTALRLVAQVTRRPTPPPPSSWTAWMTDPRNGVFLVLGLVFLLGGGRKVFQALRARQAVEGLEGDRPSLDAIAEAASHGRAAVMELFRLLGSSTDRAVRDAAGRALAVLWKADELIPEEEQAIVTRGFVADWKARRKYPRALDRPFPIVVEFGVPFLVDDGRGVGPASLEWSCKILGSERVSLETDSPWRSGNGRVEFPIDPRDFPTNGPHRLVLQARVRTVGLTTKWERELPKVPFTFEFDPNLALEALFTLPDAARESEFASGVSLAVVDPREGGSSFLAIDDEFAFRDPPVLRLLGPLPCDLAHVLNLEIEGGSRPLPAGEVVLVGRNVGRDELSIRLGDIRDGEARPSPVVDRAGEHRVRAILTPDAQKAWSDPEIRSAWPGTITTDWVTVRVVRR